MKRMKRASFFSLLLLLLLLLAAGPVAGRAATLPAQPNVVFQTSARGRAPSVGDWYTTATSSSTDRMHRFVVDVTQAMLTANGGSVSITVNDAECNGALDEVDGGAIGTFSATSSDPTRFELRTGDGVTVLQSQTFPTGSPNGQTATFTVTAPGSYQVTSVTGGFPISGDATANLNNDDNTFSLTVPATGVFIGQYQSTLVQQTAAAMTMTFYFLVPPGTPSLLLRNFDLDGDGPVIYTKPDGTTITGTSSPNGVWNGPGGTLNAGGDAINGLSPYADAGVWTITLTNIAPNNQFILEANTGGGTRLPLTDANPATGGNFGIAADTTKTTAAGTPVDHPFTVTNRSFANDVIELSTSGTAANFTVQLLDASGNALADTDGDGRLDTGVLTPAQSKNFILRVTPKPAATGPDATRVNAVSFLDVKVNPASPATLSVTKTTGIISAPVSGFVYLDANHNLFKDVSENGTGLALFAKLVPAANPAGPALQAVAVNAATGAFVFPNVTAGTYAIVIDTNATLADVTPALPAGWTGTEFPGGKRSNVPVQNTGVPDQNFGLIHALPLSGRVFADTGAGGGTANDGAPNGAESGIAGVTVALTDSSGATVYDTATTNANGDYTLFIPNTLATGAALKVVETNLASWLSTGGSAGSTGGAYDRAGDAVSFTLTAGAAYAGVNFGDVGDIVFLTDGAQANLPGSSVVYAHTFTAPSGGSVTFAAADTSTPAIAGWTAKFYRDTNGNGVLDAGEPAITGPISVTAGQSVPILAKVFIPVAAPFGAQDKLSVTANFTYANASPALASTATRTDATTVGNPAAAGLVLTKSVDKPTALPGSTLTYTITYANNSSEPVNNVVIHDSTPAFTTFLSATNGALPPGLTAVSLTAPAAGGTGAVRWTFTGSLAPAGSGTVSFRVTLAQ